MLGPLSSVEGSVLWHFAGGMHAKTSAANDNGSGGPIVDVLLAAAITFDDAPRAVMPFATIFFSAARPRGARCAN